jgi:hypothetical protein
MTEEVMLFKVPHIDNTYRVYFDIETGSIHAITNEPLDENSYSYIEVTYESVETLLNGKELFSNYAVEYDLKLKLYELKQKTLEKTVIDINELIYKLEKTEDADIQLVQDIKNTCWKFLISKEFRASVLPNKGAVSKIVLSFSVTEENNPNILYRTLKFPLEQLVRDHYVVLDFKDQYEIDGLPVSVYTIKRFNSYSFEVINE